MGKTLYIERSAASGRSGDWVESLDLDDVDRIVVGTGPGSFAGVRSAIAFAQGFALGRKCEVLGLPSPCAAAAQLLGPVPNGEELGTDPKKLGTGPNGARQLAIVGDARCGKLWIALFDGFSLVRDVFQVNSSDILGPVPNGFAVATVDEARIGDKLKAAFGERFIGGVTPTDAGLKAFAEANPSALVREPRPIYLNPAVRG